jgi:hypothetical protein
MHFYLRRKFFTSGAALTGVGSLGFVSAFLFIAFLVRFRLQFGVWPKTRVSDPSYMCNSASGMLQSVVPCDAHHAAIYYSFGLFSALSLMGIVYLFLEWGRVRRSVAIYFMLSIVAVVVTYTWRNFYYILWYLD